MDYDQLWNVWWINGGHFGMHMVNKVWNISISVYLINAMNKQVVTIVGFSAWRTRKAGQNYADSHIICLYSNKILKK